MKIRLLMGALLLSLGSVAQAQQPVPDFAEGPCKEGVTDLECVGVRASFSAYMCEINAIDMLANAELGKVSVGDAISSIGECATRATKYVGDKARGVQPTLEKRKEVVDAMKEMRVAHQVFLRGLAPEGGETRGAYKVRVSKLKQSFKEKMVALDIVAE